MRHATWIQGLIRHNFVLIAQGKQHVLIYTVNSSKSNQFDCVLTLHDAVQVLTAMSRRLLSELTLMPEFKAVPKYNILNC